jgi:hypothetical protein
VGVFLPRLSLWDHISGEVPSHAQLTHSWGGFFFWSTRHLIGAAWKPEVTEASEKNYVVVLLYKNQ